MRVGSMVVLVYISTAFACAFQAPIRSVRIMVTCVSFDKSVADHLLGEMDK